MAGFRQKKITRGQTLADKLNKARIESGLSLEELSQKTKIQIKYLEILEQGDYNSLPGDIYAKAWLKLYGELFAKYMDGNVKVKSEPKEGYKYVTPKLEQPGYGEAWYKRIVNETGEQFLMKGSSH